MSSTEEPIPAVDNMSPASSVSKKGKKGKKGKKSRLAAKKAKAAVLLLLHQIYIYSIAIFFPFKEKS